MTWLNTASASATPPAGPTGPTTTRPRSTRSPRRSASTRRCTPGHDAGASCAGRRARRPVDGGQAVTYCFSVTNTGDAALLDVAVDDVDLGIDQDDDDGAVGLAGAPGARASRSTLYYLETTVDGDLVNTAIGVGDPAGRR